MNTAPDVQVISAKPQSNGNRQHSRLRVAAYCRVSTDSEEQVNSYHGQIEYYTDYIHSNPDWKLVGIFADEGISGTQTRKRKEFNRMISMCKKKQIDLILCKSTSRFARNTVDCLEHIRLLKKLGIGVIFEKENLNTLSEYSEFMLALYSSFAQAESESISRNITMGVQMAFRSGKVRYSYKYWLGYKKGADGSPEIVPEEAETVRLIYKLYLDGLSARSIAKKLNENQIADKSGNTEWKNGTVLRILKNEKYTGDAILQKTFTVDCITHKRAKNNGERTMYYVHDCHPPIIDHATFDLVQQEMARRVSKPSVSDRCKTERGRYSGKYALTELLVCGECGTPYRRVTWNVHGKKQIVWRCISRLEYGARYCKNSPSIHEEPLHRAIVSAINAYYAHKYSVLRQKRDEITSIERRLAEIDTVNGGAVEKNALDTEFRKLREKDVIFDQIEGIVPEDFAIREYDDILVRQLLKYIRVIDKTHIQAVFREDYDITVELDKK